MKRIIFLIIGIIYSISTSASPVGLSYTQLILPQDPDHLHGFRAAIFYQPERLVWEHVQIYFDASAGHLWLTGSQPNRSLSTVAIAPYVRYWLIKKPIFSPFFEVSIAPAYISKTKIDHYNLGMHFIFQDQVSMGASWGKDQKITSILSLVHYSNGSLCSNNSGITIPIMLTLGYRF